MFIFPFATFGFLWLGFYRCFATRLGLRGAFLFSAIVWALWLVLVTEFLSAFQLLSRPYIGVAWILSSMVAFCFCLFSIRDKQATPDTFAIRKKIILVSKQLTVFDWILLSLCMVIILLIALTAFMAPPNNWDSLVYHMSRVSHWQQNQTIAHYPTNIKTQIFFAPFAEWVILHFQILVGTDRLANFVQWFAMVTSVISVTIVMRFFGGTATAQLFAAFLTLTIPMGILQGSSTQNDYVMTLWLIIFVYFGLTWTRKGEIIDAVAASAALGLAILTKGVVYLWAAPFLVWFFISGVQKFRFKIIFPIMCGCVLILAINFNYLYRNWELTGHVFGEKWLFRMIANDQMNPILFISNGIRNLGLHLATAVQPLNAFTERSIYAFHDLIRVNIAEPTTTFLGYSLHIDENLHEDVAGNFCQLVLIIASIFIFMRRKGKDSILRNYLLVLCAGGVLFNWLIKWQPSGSRLHLSLFVLFMPWVAAVLSTLSSQRRKIILIGISIIFLVTAVPYIVRNSTRKLISSKGTVFTVPRLEQYFANDKLSLPTYRAAVDFVRTQNCQQVGLRLGDNTWEYPLWVLFEQKKPPVRLEQVDVTGVNPANYPLGPFHPCVIIETGRASPPDEIVNIDGIKFNKRWEQPSIKIYMP